MRAVLQRVRSARVTVDGHVRGEIGTGLCILLGVARSDNGPAAARLAAKVARLRIFENESGKLDRSVVDADGGALVVSQFTLISESRRQRGTRPDFSHAAGREAAEPLYERFCHELRSFGVPVQTGAFGA
ncbi:MAG: D-tyrosyl-tRNA(Tyr) deacylase, partial [Actinobacteria bacterium]|nr:D-tyrosyl-tRNA(Tyr) deacylase [Actinomycetota bacterium]